MAIILDLAYQPCLSQLQRPLWIMKHAPSPPFFLKDCISLSKASIHQLAMEANSDVCTTTRTQRSMVESSNVSGALAKRTTRGGRNTKRKSDLAVSKVRNPGQKGVRCPIIPGASLELKLAAQILLRSKPLS